jgi:hypothetical protein
MSPAQEYLFKAVQLNAFADEEADVTIKLQLRRLSDCYLRLAQQADRQQNSLDHSPARMRAC